MLKKEILKNAGLKENVIIKEEPPKPRRKKKKKIVEKVKLKSLLDDLLLEAVDISSGEKITRALERGQIPGVKKKVFLNTQKDENEINSILNKVVNILSARINTNSFNAYMFLILKKFATINSLGHNMHLLDEFIDSMRAYFGNVNKQEAKQDPETRKRFEEYFNSPFNFEKAKEFEQWANKKFAKKAKAKKEDIIEVYSDNQGWTVHIPKTFAAASKLACMANRKTHWCTAANPSYFNTYSNKGANPLYIIRNERKNFLLQMDWGDRPNGAINFKNERDLPMIIKDVLELNIPDSVWKAIKNKQGNSVYDYFQEYLKVREEEKYRKKSKEEELKEKINWKVEEVEPIEVANAVRRIDRDILISTSRRRDSGDEIDNLSVEKILKGDIRNQLEKMVRGTRIFKFTSDEGRELYGVLGTVIRFIRKNAKSKHKEYVYENAFLEIEGDSVKIIDKGDIIGGDETGIPDELKKEFFKGTDFKKIEKAEIKETEGVFEFNELDIFFKKKDLFEDPISFKTFKQNLDSYYQQDGSSNVFVKKDNNGNVSAIWYYGTAMHIIRYNKEKNTVNYSNKLGADRIKNFPDAIRDKILESIEDEDIRNIFTNTIKNNQFVHSLIGGKYYYDMINNNLLDKNKNVLASISKATAIIRKLKKELSEEEYTKFMHQKSIITELKSGLKNTIEKEKYGFSGEVNLKKIRSNKELFKEKMKKVINAPSISNKKISDSERERIANEMLNGSSDKIKLTETKIAFARTYQKPEKEDFFSAELYYDTNEERTKSDFYLVGKEEPYYAIGFLKGNDRFSIGGLKSQPTLIKDGKEKGYGGYVTHLIDRKAVNYVRFVKNLLKELKTA